MKICLQKEAGMTVYINEIEIEIPKRDDVLKIGKDKFLEALAPFFII